MNYESYKLPMNKMYLHVEPSNLRVVIFNLKKKHIFIGGVGEFYNLGLSWDVVVDQQMKHWEES